LIAALTNQAMAVYEAGPSATMLERQVIRWLCALIDDQAWAKAGGVLTSGGAQANLTALLVARQITLSRLSSPHNAWKDGINASSKLRILASEHAHYSVSRTGGIMGLGTDGVIKIATNQQGQLQLSRSPKPIKSVLKIEKSSWQSWPMPDAHPLAVLIHY
jgi:L-2,4-diaminobutyrate decarboxylase